MQKARPLPLASVSIAGSRSLGRVCACRRARAKSFGFKLWHERVRSSGARRCRGHSRDDGGMACEAVFVCGKGGREMCMPVASGLHSHSWST